MRIHERVLNTIEDNAQLRRDGKYIAIPWLSLPKLSKVMPGIQKGRYYLVSANSKIGKTQLADFLFMYEPLAWAKAHPTANLKPKIFYFSLEMSKEDKILAAMAHYIFKKNGKIYTPEKLLSVYHNEFLTPEDIENVKLIKPELDYLEDHVFFIDRTRNPYGIYKTMKDYAESHGTYTKKWVNWVNNETKQIEKREVIDFYTPNDPDEIIIVLIDHISLFTPENGMTLHESISKFSSDYAITMRNQWKYCPVIVQQQAAASEAQQFTQSGQQIINKLKPSTDGLGDNKLTQRDKSYNCMKYLLKFLQIKCNFCFLIYTFVSKY